MKVGILQFELLVPAAHSLKEKRSVVNSLKHKMQNKLNIAVAEVADHDLWQKATLGVVTVGVDEKIVQKIMQSAVKFAGTFRDAELGDYQIEII